MREFKRDQVSRSECPILCGWMTASYGGTCVFLVQVLTRYIWTPLKPSHVVVQLLLRASYGKWFLCTPPDRGVALGCLFAVPATRFHDS